LRLQLLLLLDLGVQADLVLHRHQQNNVW
jgi:hypothetical protein